MENISNEKIIFRDFLEANNSKKFEGGLRFKKNFKSSKPNCPVVTIITVVKNNEKYIEETIKSVLNQKYKNIEYIIVDGNSSDGTVEIIKKYENSIDYIVSENDLGLYDAFNKGISISKGDLIGMVNSDDILLPDAIEILVKYYNKYPNIDFFFGTVKKHWGLLHGFKPWKIKFTWYFYTSHSTGFYIKKEVAKEIGKYSLKYKYVSDFDYFYRLIVHKKKSGMATKKNEIFGIFRPGGLSSIIDFWDLFFEKNQIRIDNKQNKYLILITVLFKIILHFKRIRSFKIKNFVIFFQNNFIKS